MKAALSITTSTIAVLVFLAVAVCKAQPCNSGAINVSNASPLTVSVCLLPAPPPPGVPPCFTNIPPGLSVGFPVPFGTPYTGIISATGANYFWRIAPPPPFVLTSVALPPTNQCFDVAYDPVTCTVTITLSGTGVPPCVNP
jgi:hypothetical protein